MARLGMLIAEISAYPTNSPSAREFFCHECIGLSDNADTVSMRTGLYRKLLTTSSLSMHTSTAGEKKKLEALDLEFSISALMLVVGPEG